MVYQNHRYCQLCFDNRCHVYVCTLFQVIKHIMCVCACMRACVCAYIRACVCRTQRMCAFVCVSVSMSVCICI